MEIAATEQRKKPGRRKAGSLEEEIAAQEEKLRRLREKKRREDAARLERNRKAILELIRAERLDTVDAEKWRAALPAIKRVLSEESVSEHTERETAF